MTGRTAIFSGADERADDSDKLKELFRNRAELKKGYAELKNEQYRLRQCIKEQQGATARIVQKLEHLESLLVDPEWVHTVTVYYQLRALNLKCRSKVAKFAEQLKQQREKRQNDRVATAWNSKRARAIAQLESKLHRQRTQVQGLQDRLQGEVERETSSTGLLGVFRKRSDSTVLDSLRTELGIATQEQKVLVEKLEELQSQQAPETEGLDIPTKRSINFMIIAFAQQLYLQFGDDELVALIKEAGDKSVGAINYGNEADCSVILRRVRERGERLDAAADFANELQQRAKLIAEHALYKLDDDAVPISGSVATLYAIDANGVVKQKDLNLVGENYWDVRNVLSR